MHNYTEYIIRRDMEEIYGKNFKGLCDYAKQFEPVTEEQIEYFAINNCCTIFKGSKVIINRGRKMRGQVKEVSGFFEYFVPNTYGREIVNYLKFTDGTKCQIHYCDVVGVKYKRYMGKNHEYFFRFYAESVKDYVEDMVYIKKNGIY